MLFSLRLLLFGDIYLFVFAKYDAGLIETTGAFFLVLTISLSVILFSLEYWCLFFFLEYFCLHVYFVEASGKLATREKKDDAVIIVTTGALF